MIETIVLLLHAAEPLPYLNDDIWIDLLLNKIVHVAVALRAPIGQRATASPRTIFTKDID